jgi:hypothetical protein
VSWHCPTVASVRSSDAPHRDNEVLVEIATSAARDASRALPTYSYHQVLLPAGEFIVHQVVGSRPGPRAADEPVRRYMLQHIGHTVRF